MSSFSAQHWAILIAIVVALYFFFRPKAGGGQPIHCMTCGADKPPRLRTKGSIGIEIVLWLAFLVPGLIYSIWRLTTRSWVCASCGAENIIPIDSPAAIAHRKMLAVTSQSQQA